ncbi:MAG: DUF4330 domain-containing protein [Clostridia bacterium]|nr:DUF4330 domain-containing protein [Clostridia bacterium]
MNEQTKKTSGKFNFFDFLLILLAALIVFAAAAFFFWRSDSKDETVTIRYTVLVKDMDEKIAIDVREGQEVTDTVKHNHLGTVADHRIIQSDYDQYNEEEHTLVKGSYEDLQSIYVTIESEATVTDREYNVVGMKIAVGSIVYFRTPTFIGYGYVTDLTVVDAKDTDGKAE